MRKKTAWLSALIFFGSPLALAQTAAERVVAEHAWVRLNAPGTQVTGAFMTLRNASDKPVVLTAATSPAARVCELHNHVNEGGVMKMRQIPSIALPGGGEVVLRPGGLHVMLIDLKAPLREGETVGLRLAFADGSSKAVEAQVRKPGASSEEHKHSESQKH